MKYTIAFMALALIALAACTAPQGGNENLMPTGETPTVDEEQAVEIASGASEGTFVGARLVHARPDGIQARGFAQLAWEVRFTRENSAFSDLIYVSAVSGEILRTSQIETRNMWDSDAENLIPEDEAVAQIEAEYGVESTSVKIVHAKPRNSNLKEGLPVLAYEIQLTRGNWVDLIYVDVETGEVIRTDIQSATRIIN
ncbi:PepSY domain-containing protein [Candidatus Woesearchaeota archaeon]|nr:PepSY domain-containing protein [Candidatus Woesearchaeota archaeon]